MNNKVINRLGDYCQLRNGYAFKSEDFVEDGIPVIRISDIRDGKIRLTETVKVAPREEFEKFIVSRGDILIAMSGATTGKFGVFDSNQKAYQNQRVGCFIIKDSERLDKRFLYFLISTLRTKIESEAYGGGQPNISSSKIEDYKITLPSIVDQRVIASILAKAESLISQRKESLRLLDEFLRSTFFEMFGDPIRNEKGWDTRTIEELVKAERYSIKRGPFGGALKKEIFVPDGYLVYEQFHALNDDFKFARYYINEEKFQELKAFEVKPGDVIISCSGIYLGKLAIVPEDAKKGIINQALLKLSLDTNVVNRIYFLHLFRHDSFRVNFFGDVRGSGIPNFPPMEEFKKFNFIFPPFELQAKFAYIVEKVEVLKAECHASLKGLENLSASLSQMAFKGELTLK
jgi:type I restriction enzyme S subunit